MFFLLRPILFPKCHVFTVLYTLNIPRYFLDLLPNIYVYPNLKYNTLYVRRNDLRTSGQTSGPDYISHVDISGQGYETFFIK